jgi:hypothetical protein
MMTEEDFKNSLRVVLDLLIGQEYAMAAGNTGNAAFSEFLERAGIYIRQKNRKAGEMMFNREMILDAAWRLYDIYNRRVAYRGSYTNREISITGMSIIINESFRKNEKEFISYEGLFEFIRDLEVVQEHREYARGNRFVVPGFMIAERGDPLVVSDRPIDYLILVLYWMYLKSDPSKSSFAEPIKKLPRQGKNLDINKFAEVIRGIYSQTLPQVKPALKVEEPQIELEVGQSEPALPDENVFSEEELELIENEQQFSDQVLMEQETIPLTTPENLSSQAMDDTLHTPKLTNLIEELIEETPEAESITTTVLRTEAEENMINRLTITDKGDIFPDFPPFPSRSSYFYDNDDNDGSDSNSMYNQESLDEFVKNIQDKLSPSDSSSDGSAPSILNRMLSGYTLVLTNFSVASVRTSLVAAKYLQPVSSDFINNFITDCIQQLDAFSEEIVMNGIINYPNLKILSAITTASFTIAFVRMVVRNMFYRLLELCGFITPTDETSFPVDLITATFYNGEVIDRKFDRRVNITPIPISFLTSKDLETGTPYIITKVTSQETPANVPAKFNAEAYTHCTESLQKYTEILAPPTFTQPLYRPIGADDVSVQLVNVTNDLILNSNISGESYSNLINIYKEFLTKRKDVIVKFVMQDYKGFPSDPEDDDGLDDDRGGSFGDDSLPKKDKLINHRAGQWYIINSIMYWFIKPVYGLYEKGSIALQYITFLSYEIAMSIIESLYNSSIYFKSALGLFVLFPAFTTDMINSSLQVIKGLVDITKNVLAMFSTPMGTLLLVAGVGLLAFIAVRGGIKLSLF